MAALPPLPKFDAIKSRLQQEQQQKEQQRQQQRQQKQQEQAAQGQQSQQQAQQPSVAGDNSAVATANTSAAPQQLVGQAPIVQPQGSVVEASSSLPSPLAAAAAAVGVGIGGQEVPPRTPGPEVAQAVSGPLPTSGVAAVSATPGPQQQRPPGPPVDTSSQVQAQGEQSTIPAHPRSATTAAAGVLPQQQRPQLPAVGAVAQGGPQSSGSHSTSLAAGGTVPALLQQQQQQHQHQVLAPAQTTMAMTMTMAPTSQGGTSQGAQQSSHAALSLSGASATLLAVAPQQTLMAFLGSVGAQQSQEGQEQEQARTATRPPPGGEAAAQGIGREFPPSGVPAQQQQVPSPVPSLVETTATQAQVVTSAGAEGTQQTPLLPLVEASTQAQGQVEGRASASLSLGETPADMPQPSPAVDGALQAEGVMVYPTTTTPLPPTGAPAQPALETAMLTQGHSQSLATDIGGGGADAGATATAAEEEGTVECAAVQSIPTTQQQQPASVQTVAPSEAASSAGVQQGPLPTTAAAPLLEPAIAQAGGEASSVSVSGDIVGAHHHQQQQKGAHDTEEEEEEGSSLSPEAPITHSQQRRHSAADAILAFAHTVVVHSEQGGVGVVGVGAGEEEEEDGAGSVAHTTAVQPENNNNNNKGTANTLGGAPQAQPQAGMGANGSTSEDGEEEEGEDEGGAEAYADITDSNAEGVRGGGYSDTQVVTSVAHLPPPGSSAGPAKNAVGAPAASTSTGVGEAALGTAQAVVVEPTRHQEGEFRIYHLRAVFTRKI